GSTTAPGGASVLPSASAPASTGPGPSLDGGSDVAADQSLLSFVPASGGDLQVSYDPQTTADVARDPALRASASGLAIALFTPRSTSASPVPFDDLAVVSVIRLRDPALDDAWFRDWRDSYDGAACANAGGVTRHAQTDIGGHTVFVGSCAGGAFTYHTRLAGGAIVISLTSIGPARLGQTIMERLAP
ncbi:MAG TPA: hypothetical protein VK194_00430, partial [Candidatus Deferrimicrobium sp.]|nr:hypothetical protein [Candidatus Deferrimicrobium sp.]